MKKRFLCAVLAALLTFSSLVVSAANVTMYAQDGRTTTVDSSKVDAYKKVGWYEGVTMYAADGRTTTVSPFKVADYKKVGWYDKKSDVYTLLYSKDGRITEAPKGKVKDYTSVGWKTQPVELKVTEETVNSKFGDGVLRVFGPSKLTDNIYEYNKNIKTLYVGGNVTEIGSFEFYYCSNLSRVELSNSVTKIDSYAFDDSYITRIGIPKSVTEINSSMLGYLSYYSTNNNLVIYCEKGSKAEEFAKSNDLKYVYATMIYCADGRTMMVDANEKAVYLSSGLWLDAPCTTMYTLDGKTKAVKKTDVAAYKKVGWYDKKSDVVVTMYATDGRTKEVFKANVAAEKKVGWLDGPPVTIYTLEGKTKIISKNDVAAYKKVGWYDKKSDVAVTMYATDGRTKEVFKANVAKEKAAGWFDKKSAAYSLLYSADGRIIYVPKAKVSQYTSAGWSTKYIEFTPTAKLGSALYGAGILQVFGPAILTDELYKENKNIKTLYIGNNVTKIDSFEFSNCSNLSRVEISNTVTSIGNYAFNGTKITRIGIPKSVTSFDGYAFDTHALNSYSDSENKKMVVYCEKGSKAEEFAKEKGLKYVYATMIYCADGRTMMVDATEKEAYLASGLWYTTPKIKMYSADGKTKIVDRKDVAANKKVGWYEKIDIFVPMYSADGKTKIVHKKDVAANKKVGWYSLAEYGKLLVSKKGGEAALAAVEAQENAVDTTTYNNAIKETLNAYYRKIGCPVAVITWEKGTNSIGTPEIYITFRNVSQKNIISYESKFTCYDAYGRVTTDYPSLYNGSYTGWMDGRNIAPGTKFTHYWTLYSNERTQSISWPVVQKVAFYDGSTWYK